MKIELQLLYDKCSGPSELSIEVKSTIIEHFIVISAVVLSVLIAPKWQRAAFDLAVSYVSGTKIRRGHCL